MNETQNETSDDDYCVSDTCYDNFRRIAHISYFEIGPLYVVFGCCGRFVLMLSMIKQSKQQDAYVYQTMVIISEVIIDGFNVMYLFLWAWLWSSWWYRNCYVCMWYTFKLSLLGMDAFGHAVVVMSIVMSVDRLMALRKPMLYKTFNHKRVQVVTAALSVSTGFLLHIFDCFRYTVVESDDGYSYEVDEQYVTSVLAEFLLYLRDTVRGICLILLVSCNVLLLYSLRQFRKFSAVTLGRKDDVEKRRNELMLILLTLTQCSTCIATSVALIVFYSMQYTTLADCPCVMDIASAIYDAIYLCMEMVNFAFCLVLNRKFRQVLLSVFRRFNNPLRRVVPKNSTSSIGVSISVKVTATKTYK